MLKLDNNLLDELGLSSLPEDQKRSMLQHIYDTLELRVGTNLANQMTDRQLEEFERFIDDGGDANQAQALQWLETNLPNYKQVVNEVFETLKAEIKQMAPQIMAASAPQVQASQASSMPMPPAPGQPQQTPLPQPMSQPMAQPQVPQQAAPPQYQPQQMPPTAAQPQAMAADNYQRPVPPPQQPQPSPTPQAPYQPSPQQGGQPYQFPPQQPPAGPGSYQAQ